MAGNSRNPRDAGQAACNSHVGEITRIKTVEIGAIHRYVLKAASFSPRSHDQAARRNGPRHREFSNYPHSFEVRWRAIERPIANQKRCQQPWHRDETIIDAFEGLYFSMVQCTPLDPDCQAERQEKQQANKDQNPVELECGIAPACNNERD